MSSTPIEEVEVQLQGVFQENRESVAKVPLRGSPGFSFNVAGFATIGPRTGDTLFKITGFSNTIAVPSVVLCQTRQMDNSNFGYPDQFAVQVIETGENFLRVRIRRLDNNGGGWGQNLRLDIGIINFGTLQN